MTANEKIPWKRLSMEAAAIVASILLAFAIDAWWEDRQDQESEQSALRTLREDFDASRQELDAVFRLLENAQIQFVEFQSLDPEDIEQLQQSTVDQMVSGFLIGATFDPFLGTMDAMVADGRLALIRNYRIRELLSMWLQALDDIKEEGSEIRSLAIRARTAMEPHGGPYHRRYLDQLGFPGTDVLPRADASILAELRRDVQFIGAVRSFQYTTAFYLIELRELEKILDDTIALLDQNIR